MDSNGFKWKIYFENKMVTLEQEYKNKWDEIKASEVDELKRFL